MSLRPTTSRAPLRRLERTVHTAVLVVGFVIALATLQWLACALLALGAGARYAGRRPGR